MPALHSLRGFAACWVMFYHLWFFAGTPPVIGAEFLAMGWLGVQLFYTLSAFLLTLHALERHAAGTFDLGHFYRRRALRIFPAYYAQLAVLLVVAILGFRAIPSMTEMVAHLFMFFHAPPWFVQPMNGVWWTLPIEFGFYLILPLALWLLLRAGTITFLILAFALTVAYRAAIHIGTTGEPVPVIANFIGQLPGELFVFAAGMVAAHRVYSSAARLPPWMALVAVAGSVVWIMVLLGDAQYWSGSWLLYYWESVQSVFTVTIIVSLCAIRQQRWLGNRLMAWLGDISYGVYLWHLPVILATDHLIGDMSGTATGLIVLILLVIPATLVLAQLSYRLIEKPAMAFRPGRRSG